MLQDPGRREPAPQPLRLVQAFVNTRDVENGVEELTSPEALREALARIGVLDCCSRTTAAASARPHSRRSSVPPAPATWESASRPAGPSSWPRLAASTAPSGASSP
jgi:hypothetical protein